METIWLKTIYVLFFIELGTRRIHIAGCTTAPDLTWVPQQARQLVWKLNDDAKEFAFLIHDNDKKFTSSFDLVFSSEKVEILHTPFQAPRANGICERYMGSLRRECLNHALILNDRHLLRVVREYTHYFNRERPHQEIGQRIPDYYNRPASSPTGNISSKAFLGGLHHSYFRLTYLH